MKIEEAMNDSSFRGQAMATGSRKSGPLWITQPHHSNKSSAIFIHQDVREKGTGAILHNCLANNPPIAFLVF